MRYIPCFHFISIFLTFSFFFKLRYDFSDNNVVMKFIRILFGQGRRRRRRRLLSKLKLSNSSCTCPCLNVTD